MAVSRNRNRNQDLPDNLNSGGSSPSSSLSSQASLSPAVGQNGDGNTVSNEQVAGSTRMEVDSATEETRAAPITSISTTSSTTDSIAMLENSIMLVRTSIAELSSYISAAPHGTDEQNARTLLSNKMKDLSMFTKSLRLLQGNNVTTSPASVVKTPRTSSVVPRGLAAFQWDGQVVDRSLGQVFTDVKLCIQHFQDVMNSYNLDLDSNFLRVLILPPLLHSYSMRAWYGDFLTTFKEKYQRNPTWNEFTTAIIDRYGKNIHEERAACARELNEIRMNSGESIEAFNDRFNNLCRRAVDQILPSSVLLDVYGKALPAGLYREVALATATLPEAEKNDINIISSATRQLYNKFKSHYKSTSSSKRTGNESSGTESSTSGTSSVSGSSSTSSTHKKRHREENSEKSHSSNKKSTSSKKDKGKGRADSNKWCSHHKVSTHNTEDCRAISKKDSDDDESSTKKCFKCGEANWTPGHKCKTTAHRSNADTRTFAALEFTSRKPADSAPALAEPSSQALVVSTMDNHPSTSSTVAWNNFAVSNQANTSST
ncbi:hypothetical protein ABG067_007868, partial [Albugo candida]